MPVRYTLLKIVCLITACVATSSCALLPSFGTKVKAREQVYTLNPVLTESQPSDLSSCGSLALGDAMAAPGFRSSRMAYSTASFEIDYFAYARWADSFARLLRGPLHRGFAAHGAFTEVLAAPTLAPTRFRVEFNDVSVIQRFASRESVQSTVELGASVRVFAVNPNRVLATRDYRLNAVADGDPASGVAVANTLVAQLVNEVTRFTSEACSKTL